MLVSDVGRVFDEWCRNGTNRSWNRSDHEGTYPRKFPVFRTNGERSSSQKNAGKRNLGE